MTNNIKTNIHKEDHTAAQHRAKVKVEDLESFDTSGFMKSDAERLEFLADIIKDKNPGLLSHAFNLIQKSWDQENIKK
jgi:DNA-binding phage protein